MYMVFFLCYSQNFIYLRFLIRSQLFTSQKPASQKTLMKLLWSKQLLFFFFNYHMDKYENIELFYKMFKNWLNYKVTILFIAY